MSANNSNMHTQMLLLIVADRKLAEFSPTRKS